MEPSALQPMVNMIGNFINDVGFPTFIAIYLVFRFDKTIQANTKVMTLIASKMDIDIPEVK